MTFNIEYGGKYAVFQDIVRVVQLARADVVALSEGYHSVRTLAEGLGWLYYDHGMQVVSKYPLYEPQYSDHTYLLIEVAPQRVVALSNIHLGSEPYGPTMVLDGVPVATILEMEHKTHMTQLTRHWKTWTRLRATQIPFFVTGDFNVPSHLDGPIEWPVSSTLQALGFRDTYREVFPDPVAKPGTTWYAHREQYLDHWNPTDDPNAVMDRLDFIYAGGPSRTMTVQLLGETGAVEVDMAFPGKWPSDHRAVVASFTLRPTTMPSLVAIRHRVVTVGDVQQISIRSTFATATMCITPYGQTQKNCVYTTLIHGPWVTHDLNTTTLAPGIYQVLVANHQKRVVMQSFPFEVWAHDARPRIRVDKDNYTIGDTLVVSYDHVAASRWNWVAIYDVRTSTSKADAYHAYAYVDGESTGTLIPTSHGTITLSSEQLEQGQSYTVSFLTNEYDVVCTSQPFVVS